MMVRKFYADSPREALRLVRDALGPNAMILSNRRTAAGVEIAAVAESEIASVTGGMAMQAMTGSKPERRPAEVNLRAPVAPPPTPPSTAEPAAYNLVQEVRILRSMLEGQLAAFAWH
ncbi:MAG TPA: flagellar biosynthesis protein FlhF, partial [Burkholderiales bacterium]|nr:flagellar biosynthesis protein FlhF [Burkholderiales bacterium]